MIRCLRIGRTLVVAAAALVSAVGAPAEPTVRNHEGVAYISGGVTDDEQRALEATGGRFNLKVTSALANGHFVSDTPVQIRDSQDRTVVDTVADGPLLFVQLPPGTYTVRCSLNGMQQEHRVHVSAGKQEQLACTWLFE